MRNLQALRSGNHVDLQWTTPTLTTDRLPLAGRRHGAGVLTAELCRVESTGCKVFTHQNVSAGEIVLARELLDTASETGPPRVARYRVRILNGEGRSAGWSRDALTVAGEAPAPITALAASATAQGMQLTWQAAPAEAADRILLKAVADGHPDRDLAAPAGAGGAIDTGAVAGGPVRYTVTRTRTVQLDGVALRLNGEAAAVTATLRKDTFPPTAPRGLVAIAVQMEGSAPEIDLSWEPNAEPDLAGYLVFRAEGNGAVPKRLTAAPVTTVSFRDTAVTAGHVYRYTVVAVDKAGNQSAPGTPAEDHLR